MWIGAQEEGMQGRRGGPHVGLRMMDENAGENAGRQSQGCQEGSMETKAWDVSEATNRRVR
jgi:hypothetical protein